MFETVITGESMVIKGCHSVFNSAVDQLVDYIDKPVSGHMVDGMTGEALIMMTDGAVSYISTEAHKPLMEYAEETDPALAMVLGLLFLLSETSAESRPSNEPLSALLELLNCFLRGQFFFAIIVKYLGGSLTALANRICILFCPYQFFNRFFAQKP